MERISNSDYVAKERRDRYLIRRHAVIEEGNFDEARRLLELEKQIEDGIERSKQIEAEKGKEDNLNN